MIGQTVSHYNILEKLGEGGMGIVYKAEDTKLKRTVALKFLPPTLTRDPEAKKRFFVEAQAAAALNHPNIVTIHEIGEYNNQVYMAMEYVQGENLKETIDSGPLEITKALRIARKVAKGLQDAHEKGIVHRDIKSANIMITGKNQVKVMDFGLARLIGQTRVTKAGITMGTTAYMSPEQTQGVDVDHRSDIWSLGVVLYEMVTGETPFKGEYEQAVIYSILNEEPEPVSSLRADVPKEMERIINKMLAKNPEERYQTADPLLEDLKKLKKDSAPGMTIKPSRKRTSYFYAGIAVILLLITLMGLLFFPQNAQSKKINSIAVLPFSNVKMDPETDYLGFALADQIIGDLAYIKNITIRPSSSIRKYENQIIEPIIVGDDLKVDYVLTGNFLKEGKDIRLNVELIQIKTNKMIWRERIEIEYKNAFKLQDIVSEKVIKGLSIQFTQDERDRMQSDIPSNSLAYEYYLRSISYPYSNEGHQLAIEMLKKSIELDPNYAPAYNQLGIRAQRLALFGLRDLKDTERAEKYYLKALSLNRQLLSALGDLAMLYTETARTEKAVEIARQMLKINPNSASTHYSLGYIYRYAGMLDESIQEMEKALAIDPKDPRFRSLGINYFNVGEYEKALDAFEIDKGITYALGWQAIILFRQGKQKQALDYFDRILAVEPEGYWALEVTVYKAYITGNTKEGLHALNKVEQANMADAEAWYYLAGEYMHMGDRDGCIRALRRAVDGGYFNYPFMLTDYFLDPVRDDPEFREILGKAREKHLAFRKRFF